MARRRSKMASMRAFTFRCPSTGYPVEGRYDSTETPPPSYVSQGCIACGRLHMVNPLTGKLMAEEVPPHKPR